MRLTLSRSNDGQETLETCMHCSKPFYELKAAKAKALEAGFYKAVCINCDECAQATFVNITSSGQQSLLSN